MGEGGSLLSLTATGALLVRERGTERIIKSPWGGCAPPDPPAFARGFERNAIVLLLLSPGVPRRPLPWGSDEQDLGRKTPRGISPRGNGRRCFPIKR